MRYLYVGIDGLGLDVFTDDQFGAFSYMRKAGNWGRCTPAIDHTFPSWTSLNTGIPTKDHGITKEWQDWYNKFHSGHTYIWDYMHGQGLKCGVGFFPMSHPPRQWDDGWFLSGYPADSYNFWPRNLLDGELPLDWTDYVAKKWGKGKYTAAGAPLNVDDTAAEMIIYSNMLVDVLLNLARVDFLAICTCILDRAAHEFYNKPKYDPTEAHQRVKIWVDKFLTWAIKYQQPDYILIASDHGLVYEKGDHNSEGVWAMVGPTVMSGARLDVLNHEVLNLWLDAIGWLETDTKLVKRDLVTERLKALGYVRED